MQSAHPEAGASTRRRPATVRQNRSAHPKDGVSTTTFCHVEAKTGLCVPKPVRPPRRPAAAERSGSECGGRMLSDDCGTMTSENHLFFQKPLDFPVRAYIMPIYTFIRVYFRYHQNTAGKRPAASQREKRRRRGSERRPRKKLLMEAQTKALTNRPLPDGTEERLRSRLEDGERLLFTVVCDLSPPAAMTIRCWPSPTDAYCTPRRTAALRRCRTRRSKKRRSSVCTATRG